MEGTASGRSCRRVRGRQRRRTDAACGRREVASCEDRRADAGKRFFRRSAQQSRPAERKTMIDRAHDLPIIRQAEALRVSRSSVYYLPRSVPEADLAIMRRLDRLHLEYPFAGSEAPDFPRQRPAHCPLTLGNVGGSPTPGNHTADTGLAGWGARIRTWEWRNQNPLHLVEADFVASANRRAAWWRPVRGLLLKI